MYAEGTRNRELRDELTRAEAQAARYAAAIGNCGKLAALITALGAAKARCIK